MRKDEYINEVISKIENKKARREVEKELSAHIDDRISYYTDAGYDEQTATEKAMEHMGNPDEQAEQLGKIHNTATKNIILAILNPISLLALNMVLGFIVGYNLLGLYINYELYTWTAFYIVFCVVQFFVGKRFMTPVEKGFRPVFSVIKWSVIATALLMTNMLTNTLMFWFAWEMTESFGFSGVPTLTIGIVYILLPIVSLTVGLINNRKDD